MTEVPIPKKGIKLLSLDVYEPLRKLISVKTDLTWNVTY